MEFRRINASNIMLKRERYDTILIFAEIKIVSLAIRCRLVLWTTHRYTNTNSIAAHDNSEKGGGCVPKDNSIEQIIGRRIQLIRSREAILSSSFLKW